MPKAYNSAPNAINQDEVAFVLNDLKSRDPRVWQAISSLKSYPPPKTFYAQIVLPGVQVVGNDILDHPCILRLPIDPYEVWQVNSVIVQDIEVTCKVKPSSSDYIADILITRNNRDTYVSIFQSNSKKVIIKNGGDYSTRLGVTNLGTNEFFDGDEFRVDVLQADGTVANVWVVLRGYSNLKKLKKSQ